MSTSIPTLPTGTLASDLAWNDEPQLHQRVIFHEARLGLPARQAEYVDAANYYLRTLAASHTKTDAEGRLRTLSSLPELASEVAAEASREAVWEAAQAPATTKPSLSAAPLSGYDRLARAFAGAQPAQVRASSSTTPPPAPVPTAATQAGPTGVSRLAAAFARTAKKSSMTN